MPVSPITLEYHLLHIRHTCKLWVREREGGREGGRKGGEGGREGERERESQTEMDEQSNK